MLDATIHPARATEWPSVTDKPLRPLLLRLCWAAVARSCDETGVLVMCTCTELRPGWSLALIHLSGQK